jgi:hypothetical protein
MNRSDLDVQHGHDLAEDGGLIGGDRRVGGVLRHKPHMTIGSLQGFDRGFRLALDGDGRGDNFERHL